MPTARHDRGRLLRTIGLVTGVVLLAAGALVAVRGYLATAGPLTVTRDYFAALQAADAPRALSFGAVPAGDRNLLTSTVLREQQRIAPMRGLTVGGTIAAGADVTVQVSYRLDFADAPQQVDTSVVLARADGGWRLTRTAVPTQLQPQEAADRATILGTAIPNGTVLVFPGAVPVRLDTPYLQLNAADDHVELIGAAQSGVDIALSAAGRRAVLDAVETQLQACLRGTGPITCPLPSDRYVPGSVRGTLTDGTTGLEVTLADSALGTVDISGKVAARASYRRLSFTNVVQSGSGPLSLDVHALAYAVAPVAPYWVQS